MKNTERAHVQYNRVDLICGNATPAYLHRQRSGTTVNPADSKTEQRNTRCISECGQKRDPTQEEDYLLPSTGNREACLAYYSMPNTKTVDFWHS